MKNIVTPAQLHIALANVFADTDFDAIGTVKDHMEEEFAYGPDPKDASKEVKILTGRLDAEGKPIKVPTGEVFLTASLRMPQGSALTVAGTELYPNTLQVKIDGFKLSPVRGEKAGTATAATSNADRLRAKLKGFTPTVEAHNPPKLADPVS